MQISMGCKRYEETFLATIHEASDRKDAMAIELIPKVIPQVLEEYRDMMPLELPKQLPLQKESGP